ncbi:prolyl oligopeptidase family serine peptidase [Caulobacter sp. KR2-114]|uniref:S9 family peptidase n=1 Tax=Caulobacter sp. KR2-114 TaxID=3400912 RepID=UPI003C0712ED
MRRLPALALACALAFHGAAEARPFTVDDLLKLEQRGPVQIAPGGRWAVVQTYASWDQAATYDLDWWTTYSLGRLQRVDLQSGAVQPLLKAEAGSGYVAGPMSPSGARMAVSRMTGHVWELGVVVLATGEVRWLGLSPEIPQWGREIAWRGDDELLVIAQGPNPVGHRLGLGWQGQARLTEAWANAAAGRLSATVLGSGRYRTLRPKATPRRLVDISLSTGRLRVLATGDFFDLELAPDGRNVAVMGNGDDLQEVTGPTTTGTELYRRWLILVDPSSGKVVEPCPSCDVMQGLLSWSAGGERLLIYARRGGGWESGGYEVIDARSRTATPAHAPGLRPSLVKKHDNGVRAVGGWLGDQPVIYARPSGEGGRPDWYALSRAGPKSLTEGFATPSPRLLAMDADSLVVSDGDAVWRVGADGARHRIAEQAHDLTPLSSATEMDSERLALAPRPSTALAVRSAQGLAAFARPQGAPLPLHDRETPLAVDSPFRSLIVSRKDAHGVERLTLRQAGRADRELLVLNQDYAAIDPPQILPIHHLGPDGQALTSWLYLPANLKAGEKPALVVIPYPGDDFPEPPAEQALGSFRFHANAQVLVGAGFAVLMPSLPYAAHREPMDGLADQVLAIVDAAGAQAPVDTDRLALWGHSYGAYTALALATESPRFKAIIASSGVNNLTSAYAGQLPYQYLVPETGLSIMGSSGWMETGQVRMNAPPWKDPDRYRRNSPITYVDRITAPVMLMRGDLDGDVTQAEQMFTSLYRQNKDAILVIYHGEAHVVVSPANVRDEYARALAFLAEHVGPPAGIKPRPGS